MSKIFLSAGHGGSDPGAIGNGIKEKDANLQTLLACKSELERHGVEVVASRITDENDPVSQEVKEANASGSTLAVSFHNNAGGGKGFEGYYYSKNEDGKKLVSIAQKYINALGQENHGNPVKSGDRLYFIKNTNMTAVLFETFFVDSADYVIGDTVAEQKAFGVAYAKAILEYLGIRYKEELPPATTSEPKPVLGPKEKLVKVDIANLRIRRGPGTNFQPTGAFTGVGTFTINSIASGKGSTAGWGRLKSGAGWISLDFAKII